MKCILIIDNEPCVQEITQISLETTAGWQVITAGSGSEGILKAEQAQPDAILLDLMMPDMDGIATFRQLQANPATWSIPVLLLTARAQPTDQERYCAMGIRAVITKPFEPLSLAQELAQILGWIA